MRPTRASLSSLLGSILALGLPACSDQHQGGQEGAEFQEADADTDSDMDSDTDSDTDADTDADTDTDTDVDPPTGWKGWQVLEVRSTEGEQLCVAASDVSGVPLDADCPSCDWVMKLTFEPDAEASTSGNGECAGWEDTLVLNVGYTADFEGKPALVLPDEVSPIFYAWAALDDGNLVYASGELPVPTDSGKVYTIDGEAVLTYD